MSDQESPYAAPGGRCCMYCGTRHSSRIDCRPQCTEPGCTSHGIPWRIKEEKTGTRDTEPLCEKHRPRSLLSSCEIEPLPVPPPPKEAA